MTPAASSVVELRRELHRHPELSGSERHTARRIVEFLEALKPQSVIQNLGGHGVAAVFAGPEPGRTVLLRSELDALPITTEASTAYSSVNPGVSHQCGHDGHMSILAEVGLRLSADLPRQGRVVLLFQPAEETGQGAQAVLNDAQFMKLHPDVCFAMHNVPGFPLGQVATRRGTFSAASRGMVIHLEGAPAHAAQPETGRSPAGALAEIITGLNNLPPKLLPLDDQMMATVVGARLGDKAFGTAPGRAELWATLRSAGNAAMDALVEYAEDTVRKAAESGRLNADFHYEDVFSATVNDAAAVDLIFEAAQDLDSKLLPKPFPWSEDFGRFTAVFPGAMFALGAGEDVPNLHSHDYEFPEALIGTGADIFMKLITRSLSRG